MLIRILALSVAFALGVAAQVAPAPRFLLLPAPAAAGASAPQLINGSDGTPWLSWVEPVAEGEDRLMCAPFNPTTSTWHEPREIARGANWVVNWADTPQLAAGGRGRLAAVWYVATPHPDPAAHGGYSAWYRLSTDAGEHWSEARRLTHESAVNEFVSVAPLPDGRWIAIWLDGRARHASPAAAMRLYGRVLEDEQPDQLLDDRVCDCCATALSILPDGSAYGVYRDRSDTEIRDLAGVRWRDNHWTPARALPADGWKIDGCPVNGAALARVGSRLGLVWFTGANNEAQIKATTSTDFAIGWQPPQRLDSASQPLGRVGATYLRDGSLWASWLESSGDVRLARLFPGQSKPEFHRLPANSATGASRAAGVPRLAQVMHSHTAQSRLLLARTVTTDDGKVAGISTTLVEFPLPAESAAGATLSDDCGCDQTGAGDSGHPVRGRVVRLLPERESVLVAHEEVPGVMRAMTMAFRVDPRLLEFLRPEQEIVGRMARRDDGRWWLFNVRFVEQDPAGK